MCPLGSDPFEIIEYIQYYKERRKTNCIGKTFEKVSFYIPKMYVRITVNRFGWKRLLPNLTLTHIYNLAMFISGALTFAGFCLVNDALESRSHHQGCGFDSRGNPYVKCMCKWLSRFGWKHLLNGTYYDYIV